MTNNKWPIKRILKTIWFSSASIFTIWLFYSYQSKGVSDTLLQTSGTIKVEQMENFYSFEPAREFKEVLIFYPGAMVDPKAYVPLCRRISENNIKVYLIKMPWRLATLNSRF